MDAKPAESQGRDSNENQAAEAGGRGQPTRPDRRSSDADQQWHVEHLAQSSGTERKHPDGEAADTASTDDVDDRPPGSRTPG